MTFGESESVHSLSNFLLTSCSKTPVFSLYYGINVIPSLKIAPFCRGKTTGKVNYKSLWSSTMETLSRLLATMLLWSMKRFKNVFSVFFTIYCRLKRAQLHIYKMHSCCNTFPCCASSGIQTSQCLWPIATPISPNCMSLQSLWTTDDVLSLSVIPHPVFFCVTPRILHLSHFGRSADRERDESQRTFSTTSHNILLSGNSGYAESIVAGQHSLFLPLLLCLVLQSALWFFFPLEHQFLLSTPIFNTKQQWGTCHIPLRRDVSGVLDGV